MPTYEYECTKCGHAFEKFQSITDKPLARCPECRGKLRRLLGTGAAIVFKGSGFHQTDYRSESYKKAAKAEVESASKPPADSKSGEPSKPKPDKTPKKAASSD